MSAPASVGTELPNEIARVDALRDVYLDLPNGAGRPAALMMRVSLDRARSAIVAGDVVAQIRALEDLRGYTE